MIVRCGRCRAELEVSGPGEFMCPACGTRNVVRGAGAAAPPYGPGVSGLTLPGGGPAPTTQPPGPAAPAPGVTWIVCPACSYRFVVGDVEKVSCPNCRSDVEPPASVSAP